MSHRCKAIVVHCIDFRLQKFLCGERLEEKIGHGEYDRVSWAGGVLDLDGILKQIGIAVRLHGISQAILINHEDCGAYGATGTLERHAHDLRRAAREIRRQHPQLSVELYYLHLDGKFEPIT